MTYTKHLEDPQRAMFAACGLIVIDGEPAALKDYDGTILRGTIPPEGWRLLTEPCNDRLMVVGATGDWHDIGPNPDCVGGRRVVTLTATCPKCVDSGWPGYVPADVSEMSGSILNDTGGAGLPYKRCDCTDGVVTLGRFTIALWPVVDGHRHEWDVERDGPAVLAFDPPYTQAETGQVWTVALYVSWGEYEPLALDPLPRPGQFVAGPEVVTIGM